MGVPGPLTLVINLKSPPTAGDLLLAFSYIDGMVIAPSAIPTAGTKPVGSGPFELKSFAPGSEVRLEGNTSAWEGSQYKLAGVNFVEVSPGPQAVSALVSGDVDMVDLQPQ